MRPSPSYARSAPYLSAGRRIHARRVSARNRARAIDAALHGLAAFLLLAFVAISAFGFTYLACLPRMP